MKKFKISILAIFAIIIGIAGSAFTSPNSKLQTDNWYVLANGTDPTVRTNYTLSTEPDCEASPETVCAIQVPESTTNPSQNALNAIMSASGNFTEDDPNVKYKP